MRIRACLRDESFRFPSLQHTGNIAVAVIEVSEIEAFCRTYIHAGRCHSVPYPVKAECALIHITCRMRVSRIVWAGCNTGAASYANTVFNNYNTAFLYPAGTCWTAPYARGIGAMVASLRSYFYLKLRICSIHYFNHPVAAKTNRHIIFCLTGYNTIAAPNTFPGINCHSISHDATSCSDFSVTNVTKLDLIPVPPISGSTRTFVINWVSLTPLP